MFLLRNKKYIMWIPPLISGAVHTDTLTFLLMHLEGVAGCGEGVGYLT